MGAQVRRAERKDGSCRFVDYDLGDCEFCDCVASAEKFPLLHMV